MRWYYIKFTPTAEAQAPAIPGFLLEYGSALSSNTVFNPSGLNLAGALEVEFNIEITAFDQRPANIQLRIYNPTLDVLSNSLAYRGMQVDIYGGFTNFNGVGLPLADPNTSGLLGSGKVFVSYANWVGGDMVLELVIAPYLYGVPSIYENPLSNTAIQFQWTKGQSFSQVIENTFKPLGFTNIRYSYDPGQNQPVWPGYDVTICANDITSFSIQLRRMTADLLNTVFINGIGLFAEDSTHLVVTSSVTAAPPVAINPAYIIGQPTLAYTGESFTVQSVHPLRANILPGMKINFKNVFFSFTGGPPFNSNKPLIKKDQDLFVWKVRHYGKFRDPSYQGWVTVYESRIDPPV